MQAGVPSRKALQSVWQTKKYIVEDEDSSACKNRLEECFELFEKSVPQTKVRIEKKKEDFARLVLHCAVFDKQWGVTWIISRQTPTAHWPHGIPFIFWIAVIIVIVLRVIMDVIFADNYNYIVYDQRMMKIMVMLIIRILGKGGPCPREYILVAEAGGIDHY